MFRGLLSHFYIILVLCLYYKTLSYKLYNLLIISFHLIQVLWNCFTFCRLEYSPILYLAIRCQIWMIFYFLYLKLNHNFSLHRCPPFSFLFLRHNLNENFIFVVLNILWYENLVYFNFKWMKTFHLIWCNIYVWI